MYALFTISAFLDDSACEGWHGSGLCRCAGCWQQHAAHMYAGMPEPLALTSPRMPERLCVAERHVGYLLAS